MSSFEGWTELNHDFVFVIDTNQIAVPFYKELCAYCTGFFHDDLPIDGNDFYVDLGIDEDDESSNPLMGCVCRKFLADEDASTPCCVWLNKRYGCDENGRFELLDENNCQHYEFPAPMSVGIFMESEPTKDQADLIKARAQRFAQKRPELAIEGFRLIQHVKLGKEQQAD